MFFYELIRFLCRPFLRLLFKVNVVGKSNIDFEVGGLILVSNHKSNLDPVFLGFYSKRRLFFMAKNELFLVPVLGYIIKKLGAFPVKRGCHDADAISAAKNIVNSGSILAIFPEGTRSKCDGEILKFKPGAVKIAAATGCKILPCSIFYSKTRFRRCKVFLEYGEAVTLQQLAGGRALDLTNLSNELLKELSSKLKGLVVKMNNGQKSLSC